MPPKPHEPNCLDSLRVLIDSEELHIKQLARKAEVDYQQLWRWHTRRTPFLNILIAEAVYYTLTGKTFTQR